MTVTSRRFGQATFTLAGDIDAVRDSAGVIRSRTPQARYAKASDTSLNPHGDGPFADLVVPDLPSGPGVYAVTVAGELVYVGIAKDLRERWGPRGYSRIHPRNCYVGGQSTNCKVNAALLEALLAPTLCSLWICQTVEPRKLESALIVELQPRWNSTRK